MNISGHMEFGYQNKGRVQRIIDFLETYVTCKDS